ncbi:ABC transporter ATP-binding protein [Rhizobium mayense]|uniref:ABC transporter ATP-binding protein n=1 Tax=Rhizobium mayense TaxID=1312184 RepID=A0ABT7K922_9HYPH|nr:ABC transporter ATP-binding protein [Rhizobium mayense]MDL2403913.1 ABC transporter ATP-binding protein [Rhizobium mayense]
MTILRVAGIGKAYWSYKSEWHRFARWLGFKMRPADENWVLRDVSFDIQPGEAIGIIGRNGAGKSTLLKIITGTTRPTEGMVQVNGRVSAILELGMGFNPDLTGRQNVYHTAGLMGFTRAQIDEAIGEIEAFAEIGHYFDEAVRTYSSGMQVRVAFAVATAWRPEILIVDEALSVGDAYFQHKSFARIQEFVDQGTSLLLVSHDRGSILKLCNRAILLDAGGVVKAGDALEVCDYYNAYLSEKKQAKQTDEIVTGEAYGTGECVIESVAFLGDDGSALKQLPVGANATLRIVAAVRQPIDSLVLGFAIKDRLGIYIFGTNTWYTDQVLLHPVAGDSYVFDVKMEVNLGPGSYTLQCALVDKETHLSRNYEWRDRALIFDVFNEDKPVFIGQTWLKHEIKIHKKDQ